MTNPIEATATENTENTEEPQPTLSLLISAILPIQGTPEDQPKMVFALMADGTVRWATVTEDA